MLRWIRPRWPFALLAAPLLLLACGDDDSPTGPDPEILAALAVTPLGIVEPGRPVDLLVEAVGSRGTRPFPAEGTIAISPDRGTVTPDALALTDGTARGAVQLSAPDSTVVLTASLDAVTGSAPVNLSPIAILPGDPSAPVEGAIPVVRFSPRPGDYRDGHPEVPDLRISYNTLSVMFALGTTVGEANALLTPLQPEIVGGYPGVVGTVPGILALRVPSLDHATMTAMIARLAADSRVEVAVEDLLADVDRQPQDGNGIHSTWVWETTPGGGNWGLEMCRVPALWNLNPALEKARTADIALGMIDTGQMFHDDYAPGRVIRLNPGFDDTHGTHVAGTMVATFDNGVGMEGVHPYATLRTVADTTFSYEWERNSIRRILDEAPHTQVINVSLGTRWKTDPATNLAAQLRMNVQGILAEAFLIAERARGRAPVLCVAAGNASNKNGLGDIEAVWNSQWANAALARGVEQILVIENVRQDAGDPTAVTRANDSNLYGFLSAPGTSILSTWSGNGYRAISGTSMASPLAAGVVAYLWSLEPTLTVSEIRQALFATSQPAGGNASERIDAFGAALQIDEIRGGDAVVRRLLDIDDGTVDGNRRIAFGSSTDYLEEDADSDGGVGDGVIDMSDFRRWRDWYLITKGTPGLDLDGSQGHPKTDVNQSGFQDPPSEENVWPRGDFNGDGRLSLADRVEVPGFFALEEKTDLEMLQEFFDDPDVSANDLPGLIESGDIHVDLSGFLGERGSVSARVRVLDGISEAVLAERTVVPGQDAPVLTVVSGLSLYRVETEGRDGGGSVVCADESEFTLAPGEDVYLAPSCSSVELGITLARFLEPGVPSPVVVRAGVKADTGVTYAAGLPVSLTATGATLAAANGSTDPDGFFETEITLADDTEVATVFATATDPATGSEATASASARKLPPSLPSRLLSSRFNVVASAKAAFEPNDSETAGTDQPFFSGSVSASSEYGCPSDPAAIARASSEGSLDAQVVPDLFIEAVRAIELEGMASMMAQSASGDGCGEIQTFARAAFSFEVAVRTLDEPGFLDIDLDLPVSGTKYTIGLSVTRRDTTRSNPISIYDADYSDLDGSPPPLSDSVELEPHRIYEIALQGQSGVLIQNRVATAEGAIQAKGALTFRRTNP